MLLCPRILAAGAAGSCHADHSVPDERPVSCLTLLYRHMLLPLMLMDGTRHLTGIYFVNTLARGCTPWATWPQAWVLEAALTDGRGVGGHPQGES